MKLMPVLIALFLLFAFTMSWGQEQKEEEKPERIALNGYLKFLQTVQFREVDENWVTDNVFHNRLNFKWYPVSSLTVTAELRTRLFYGETVKTFPQYPDLVNNDDGYVADLSAVLSQGNSYFVHAIMDRFNVDWSKGKWQVKVGRQRINWGQNFVWNPNDVFNAYSFFDFDYEERPGSDAALVRYYTSATSSIEFAAAFSKDKREHKIAAMYRWNRSDYDFQVLAGKVGLDYAIGGGWSGAIGGAGFKGEITWLEPADDILSGTGALVAAVSGDYTFDNSLFVHSEIIYNSDAQQASLGGVGLNVPGGSRSPRSLTFTEWSWFNEGSYQITPLLKAGLYSIYYPGDRSVFLGPNTELSISDNVYLLFMGQLFFGSADSIYADLGYFNYLRLKWNF